MDRFCRGRADSSVKKGAAQGIPGGRRAGKRAARRDGGLLAWMGGKRLRDKGLLAWIVNAEEGKNLGGVPVLKSWRRER